MARVVFDIVANASGATVAVQQFSSALAGTGAAANSAANQSVSAFDRMEKVLGKARSAVIGFVSAFVFIHAIRSIREIISAGIDFEESFSGIRKTVEGTEAQFESLRMAIRQLARDIPISVGELNKIGEIAGQLGVPTEQILEFTETIAKIGMATNLSVEEAANGFARFNAIMGDAALPVKTLGGVIVDLGNKFPATEQEILSFSLNIAGAARQVGLSSAQVTALAATLASVGLHSEKAGTAISRIFIEMGQAVDKGGIKLQNFAAISGVTAADFSRQFKEDAAKSLLVFLSGLNAMADSGQNATIALESVGIKEVRVRDVTLRLKEAMDFLSKAFVVADENAGNAGKALEVEVGKKAETAASQLKVVSQRLHDIAIAISNSLVSSLVTGAKIVADFGSVFVDSTGKLTDGSHKAANAVKALIVVLGTAGLAGALTALSTALTATGTGFLFAQASSGALLAGLGLVVYAILNVVDAWDLASAAQAEATNNTSILSQKTSELQAKLDRPFAQGATQSLGEYSRETIVAYRAQIQHELSEVAATKALWGHAAAAEGTGAVLSDLSGVTHHVTLVTEEHAKALKKAAVEAKEYVEFWDRALNTFRKESSSGGSADDQIAAGVKAGEESAKRMIEHYKDIRKLQLDLLEMNKQYLTYWDEKLQEIKTKGMVSGNDDIEAGIKAAERTAEAIIKKAKEVKEAGQKMVNDIANDISRMFIDSITHGKSLWEAFKNLGTAAIASIADTFIKTMVHGVLDQFAAKFGQWQKSFGEWIKNNIGMVTQIAGIVGGIGAATRGTAGWGKVAAGAGGAIAGGVAGTVLAAGTAGVAGGVGFGGGIATLVAATGPLIPIAAAAAAALIIFGHAIGKTHLIANKFVQEVQNPMTNAVGDLFDALVAAKSAGTLTVGEVEKARTSFEKMWVDFQAHAAKAGIVGQQAMATMGPFVDQWRTWLDALEEDAKRLEREAKISGFTDSVLKAADSFTGLDDAIIQLIEAGIPADVILRRLGSDVESFYGALVDLGLPIPDIIQQFHDMAEAEKALEKNLRRLESVESEIENTYERLIGAINSKIDYLEREIGKSNAAIDGWRSKIKDLNGDIQDASKKLRDVKYWQKEYTSAIREAESEFEKARDKRLSTEERIHNLEIDMRREQYRMAVEAARGTEDEVAIAIAENAMRTFENEQRSLEMKARADELQRLKDDLPDIIHAQEASRKEYERTKIAAEAEIAARKTDLENYISTKIAERDQLRANIIVEQDRITVLETERQRMIVVLAAFGAVRKTEYEQIDATIQALMVRGAELLAERDTLLDLTGVTNTATTAINNFAAGLRAIASIPPPSASGRSTTPPNVPPPGSGAPPPLGPGSVLFNPTSTFNGGPGTDPRILFGVRSAALGAPDTGPNTGLWLLHPHERVLTAEENQRYGDSPSIGEVTIQLNVTNASGEFTSEKLMHDIDLNKGRIKDRLQRALNGPVRNRLVYK